jgi:hypothetical protein
MYVMLIFCNQYQGTVPSSGQLQDYENQLKIQISSSLGFDQSRIQGFSITSNPSTGQLVLQFTILPGSGYPTEQIYLTINSRVFRLTDMYNNVIYSDCDNYKNYNWTDSGPCPDKPCKNSGICGVRSTGEYYCSCGNMYPGRYCQNNLWPLLIIPIVIIILIIVLIILFCCRNPPPPASASPPESPPPAPAARPPPKNTFWLPTGKPLAVGFNDNTLKSAGAPVSGRPPPSLLYNDTLSMRYDYNPDCEPYYMAAGPNMALAFNDYTFIPRPASKVSVLFSNKGDDHSEPNDGNGVYQQLGQKLSITLNKH